MFIVFDGMDGAGKTTQLHLFVDWLRDAGQEVATCKDPGTTKLGIEMRALLLGHHPVAIDVRSETLMFMTARAQLVEQFIRPALHNGKTVVCDRYVFSTVVYQGYGGGLDPETIWGLNDFATAGLMADLTFIFDLDAKIAMSRLGDSLDRMESRSEDYFRRICTGFVAESKRWPTGVELIDASRSIDEIQSHLRQLYLDHG